MDEKRLAQRLEWINQHPEVELKTPMPEMRIIHFQIFYQKVIPFYYPKKKLNQLHSS